MKLTHITLVLIFGLLILGCDRCKQKDPDPCASLRPNTANFTIDENWTFDPRINYPAWISYISDTVLSVVPSFIAILDSSSDVKYTWEIGRGKYTQRKFSLYFKSIDTSIVNIIPVKLTVNKGPSSCFARDSATATFTKNLVLAKKGLYIGKFFGKWSGDINDTATVIINGESSFPRSSDNSLYGTHYAFNGINLFGNRVICYPRNYDFVEGYKEFILIDVWKLYSSKDTNNDDFLFNQQQWTIQGIMTGYNTIKITAKNPRHTREFNGYRIN